jgi:hypothetical protein
VGHEIKRGRDPAWAGRAIERSAYVCGSRQDHRRVSPAMMMYSVTDKEKLIEGRGCLDMRRSVRHMMKCTTTTMMMMFARLRGGRARAREQRHGGLRCRGRLTLTQANVRTLVRNDQRQTAFPGATGQFPASSPYQKRSLIRLHGGSNPSPFRRNSGSCPLFLSGCAAPPGTKLVV